MQQVHESASSHVHTQQDALNLIFTKLFHYVYINVMIGHICTYFSFGGLQ